ncbi:hypothetical protein AB0K60_06245 [Thermopolyspora sp. NPDC052614]|uniref:hypothetical protein n=1 Tax=Thermopolyspora sp. NPDC052614 TaxID=3155682 RepID=UPI0034222FD4
MRARPAEPPTGPRALAVVGRGPGVQRGRYFPFGDVEVAADELAGYLLGVPLDVGVADAVAAVPICCVPRPMRPW